MIIETEIFKLKKLSDQKDVEAILDIAEEHISKGEFDLAKTYLLEGLRDTKLLDINTDPEKGEIRVLDGGYYFKLLGEIYLKEGNKFKAGESFVKAIEEIIDDYEIEDFDKIIKEYKLEELLDQTDFKHKAFTGWFGKET